MLPIVILVAIIIVGGIVLIGMYNGLVKGRFRVKEAWSGIDVQLKRRSSLIPNLVETVKGYATHEQQTFENVTRARAMLDTAMSGNASVQQTAAANNMLTGALRSLFAVSEAYPNLKANENFLQLQAELTDTEEKIAYARQFYNTNVLSFNTSTSTFPNVIIANMFGFQPEQFFEAEPEAREDIHVNFGTTPPAAAVATPPAEPPATPTPGA